MPAKQDLLMPKKMSSGINQNSTQSVTGSTSKVVCLISSSLLEHSCFFPTFNRRPPEVEEMSSKAKCTLACRGSHEFAVLMSVKMNSQGNINYRYKAFFVNSQKTSSELSHKMLDCIVLLTPTFKEDTCTPYYQYNWCVTE